MSQPLVHILPFHWPERLCFRILRAALYDGSWLMMQLNACQMQRPLDLTDWKTCCPTSVVYSSNPWQRSPVPDHQIGYVNAGLPECQPDNVCSELVRRLTNRITEEVNRDVPVCQTALVSSMCWPWLHSAGATAINAFPCDGLMTFGYSALSQSLAS